MREKHKPKEEKIDYRSFYRYAEKPKHSHTLKNLLDSLQINVFFCQFSISASHPKKRHYAIVTFSRHHILLQCAVTRTRAREYGICTCTSRAPYLFDLDIVPLCHAPLSNLFFYSLLLPHSSIAGFRARVHCFGCLLIAVSANPVSCYERCVAPPF